MVASGSTAPTIAAPSPPHYAPDMPMASGSELRLNLKALGVDGTAPDFGERLCQPPRDNEPYDVDGSRRSPGLDAGPYRPPRLYLSSRA